MPSLYFRAMFFVIDKWVAGNANEFFRENRKHVLCVSTVYEYCPAYPSISPRWSASAEEITLKLGALVFL